MQIRNFACDPKSMSHCKGWFLMYLPKQKQKKNQKTKNISVFRSVKYYSNLKRPLEVLLNVLMTMNAYSIVRLNFHNEYVIDLVM